MKINIERLKNNICKVGEIGKQSSGGISRLAFSKEFSDASKILIQLMKDANLDVTVDGLGDILGKREGKNNDLPAIMIGSHLDTVKHGGLFDGNLGVIAALECMYVLEENNIVTNHPIEIVAFNAEEGSEMGGTFASRVMVGLQNPNEEGLEEKLRNYGLTIENVKSSMRNLKEIKCFLELHIEQGADLYNKEIPIGIVEGIAGITRYKITSIGEANHAGTTPMRLRKDALLEAAKLIMEINDISRKIGEPLVATVGSLKVFPDAVNVIPGSVEFVLELRDLEQYRIDKAIEEIKRSSKKFDNVRFEFEHLIDKTSVTLDKNIINIIEKSCINNNVRYQIMPSGAGHDAKAIAKKIPTGMIFVPSKDGKSHCSEEWTDWKDIKIGTKILLDTIIELDKNL